MTHSTPKCNSNTFNLTYSYAAKLGYFKDDYSQEFLKRQKKMFPIINRGTWARVYAYRNMIIKFLQAHHEQECNILSLGAGYDSTFFWLHDSIQKEEIKDVSIEKLVYIEIDYNEVVVKKLHALKNSEVLSKISKLNHMDITHDNKVNAPHYKLIAQDLKCTDKLIKQFQEFGIKESSPTFILSECLFCYMANSEAEKILTALNQFFKNDVIILNYEMIHPNDPFGKVMIENLEDRGCMLPGFIDVPDEKAQEKRMKDVGFTEVECINMNEAYYKRFDQKERERIEKIEIFDEFEEWTLLQSHYCLCLGKRISNKEVSEKLKI